MSRLFAIVSLACFGFSVAGSAHAQQVFLPEPLTLQASPSSPAARQQVQIRASTPTFDTGTTFFEWTVDGAKRQDLSGYGKNTITLTAGEMGSSLRAAVAAVAADGRQARQTRVVYVANLALVWQAETLKPLWYRGKALAVPGSFVTVTAMPEIAIGGQRLRPENLSYQWSVDDQTNVSVGVGKQSIRLQTSEDDIDSRYVAVIVEDLDKRIKKEGRVYITTQKPDLVVYRTSPLGGIEPSASLSAQTSRFRPGTIDLQAEPFFFPAFSRRSLSYKWSVAGVSPPGNPQNPYSLTINTDQQRSTIPASLQVTNDTPFLSVLKTFNLFIK